MAVTDRGYRPWTGETTPYLQRMMVIPRFALRQVFQTKFIRTVYGLCLLPCLLFALTVYVAANLDTISAMLNVTGQLPDIKVEPWLYAEYLGFLLFPVMLMTLVAGPPLIALDLANGAVPLYLSKALRSRDYIAGKALVLIILLSTCSWIPLLGVYFLQYGLADEAWRSEHLWLGGSILLVGLATVVILTVLALAVSAHVKRTRLARIALLFLLFGSSAIAGVANQATHSEMGSLLSPAQLLGVVAEWSFTPPEKWKLETAARERAKAQASRQPANRWRQRDPLGVPLALLGLGAWTAGALWTVGRKIRPVEVVG